MLIKIAAALVAAGILLLVVGVLIARQYTLRAKLLTAFMFILLVSLGSLSFIDSMQMSETLQKNTNKLLLTAARQQAENIDAMFESLSTDMQTYAELPDLAGYVRRVDGANADEYRRRAQQTIDLLLARNRDELASLDVLDADGEVLVSTRAEATHNDIPGLLQRVYTRAPGQGGYTPVVFDESDNAYVHFISPIRPESGETAGYLHARYSADKLSTLVDGRRHLAGRGSFVMLLDENHLRLVHGRSRELRYTLSGYFDDAAMSRLRQQSRIPRGSRRLFIERTGFTTAVGDADFNTPYIESPLYGLGEEVFSAAVADTNLVPWHVVYAQPRSILLEPAARQTQMTLLFAGVIAALVALMALAATHVLLSPVRNLTRVVKRFSDGDFDARAQVETNDEIGSLATAFNDMSDNIERLVGNLESEVDLHKQTADSLRKLSQAIEQSPVSVMITDLDGNIEYVNPEFSRVTGYSADEVRGRNPRFLKSGHTPTSQFTNMWNSITTGQSWSGELYNRKKNGELFWENVTISPIKSADGRATHYLAIKEDISIRKDYEDRLMYQASYDNLTDLPNRTLAYDRLRQALANAIRDRRRLAILYIDFDHFKNINDTLGHTAGDTFLIKMAGRLKGLLRDIDTVARLGGDEFMLILAGSGNATLDASLKEYEKHIEQRAEHILAEISSPCLIEDMEFSVTASIGIAIFPEDGDDAHILLKNADTAMYRSKSKGRNAIEIFTPEMSDKLIRRVEIETRLRRALEDDCFSLHYQSLIDIHRMRHCGAEALLRWEDEDLGNVPPEVFVPFAEETGIIVDIGRWVIEQVCRDINRWRSEIDQELYVAINLSGRQFRGRDIAKQIADTLSRHDLKGEHIELEITERLLMKDLPDVISTLNQFKEMGISLSIDDFGTGYSSLSYLKRFPFDVLKIDKAFVQDIGIDPDDASLCEAIINMAHSLGLRVVGEGIENEEQFRFLKSRGVEIVQGFYISKPMPQHEFMQFVTAADWIASLD